MALSDVALHENVATCNSSLVGSGSTPKSAAKSGWVSDKVGCADLCEQTYY